MNCTNGMAEEGNKLRFAIRRESMMHVDKTQIK
jgi:hypothetical protein